MLCRPLATIALLLATVAWGQAPAPLPDPSFEQDPPAWTLIKAAGAEGTATRVATPRTGQYALQVAKTSGLGYLLLQSPPLKVAAGAEMSAVVHLRCEARSYDTLVYFVNVDLDAEGKEIYPVHYSAHHYRRPSHLPPGQWARHPVRWQPNAGAVATRLRVVVAGNPCRLLFDDAEFGPAAKPAVHAGVHNSTEPPFDEAKARANLARRVAQPARCEPVGGRPVISVGDAFRAALIHQGCFWQPAQSRYRGFAAAGVHLQTVAVQMGPLTDLPQTAWKYPQGCDFRNLERDLLQAVGADPLVQVILLVRCDAPRQWTLDHPDHVWTAENGRKWICGDGMHPTHQGEQPGPRETLTASYGSPLYAADLAQRLTELGTYLARSEVGKLVVGFMVGGCNDGQFFDGSLGGEFDHSPGHQLGFRAWLREQYRDDAALQRAWGEPQARLATATVAPEAARKGLPAFATQPGREQRVADSARYSSVSAARLVRYFARALKRALGRPAFTITYWPDAAHDGGLNRYALAELMDGPDRIDAVATVHDYGEWRQLGGTGGVNGVWGAHRLRGVLPIVELDYRTYRSGMAEPWGVDQLGATLTAEGFRAQALRDIGAAASRGMGAWFYDMSGGWYDDPALWPTVAESARIMAWAHRPEAPAPAARLAVLVDEEAGWRATPAGMSALHSGTNPQRLALNLSGVPYDYHLLDDVRRTDFPDYRATIVLAGFCLRRPQVAALKQRCLGPGKVLVLPAATGLASPDYPDATALVKDLCGLDLRLRPAGARSTCVAAPGSDPLAAGLDPAFVPDGQLALPSLLPVDPRMTVFGRFADGEQAPSHAVARTPQGAVVVVNGPLTPQLVANVAREAGITGGGTAGQVTYVGCGVAVAHRVAPGPLEVRFEQPVDLLATDGTTVVARGQRSWSPEVKLLETAVVLYRAAR